MSEYIVQTRRLTKHYGGVKALTEVDLSFEPGLIHALVGENGAGKSTLIRILSGIEPPTSGEVLFEGGLVEEFSPHAAHDRGISTVYQEPMQVGLMTIEENIYVGRYEKNRLGFVDYRALRRKVTALMDEIGIHLPPRAVVGELSVAKRQMVEILKALSFRSRFIIFDEPTASLTTEECDNLKQIIRRLKEQGITVLYISHRLEEIFDLCDTVTVLRDGMFVGKRQVSEIDQDQLIRMMVGRSMENLFPKKEVLIGEQILELRHVESASVHDISFTLHRGEILGFAGLVGAGRTETANVLFGIDPDSGQGLLEGRELKITSPAGAIAEGIGLVPEDRKHQGLVQLMSVRENITLSSLQRHVRGPLLDHEKERATSAGQIGRLRIKTPTDSQPVSNLSGGNQQKVVFAKWMSCLPKVIILDEPTQGVDVGAKAEIYTIISALAESGVGVLLISSEMTELIAMCDRICVMREGRINRILARGEFSEDTIMRYAIEEVK